MSLTPFHIAFPVHNLDETRAFYGKLLGCQEGRSSDQWIDFNLFGHQIVAHLHPRPDRDVKPHHNPVDGHDVPVPHFGVVLAMDEFERLVLKLKAANVTFEIEPTLRFEGQPGEQATMFFYDPSGNALEFKSFKDMKQLFAK